MRHLLSAAATLAAALAGLGLTGCDAADRAALAGLKSPPAAVAQTPAPATANAALLFPPAAQAGAPRLHRVSTAPRGMTAGGHRHLVRVAEGRRYERVPGRAEQTVTGYPYGEEASYSHHAEAEARWDERRSTFAEGYGAERYGAERHDRDDLRAARASTVAGRDRDGFLTWPGKTPDRH
jgi:hypothetical protein